MARKTLLNEQEVRKFLKLANIKTVGEEKIQEMYGDQPGARDMEMDDEEAPEELEVAMDDEPGDNDELEVAVDDVEVDVADDGAGDLDVSEREEIMADVVAAVAQALGIEDRVDIEAGEEDAMAMDMGDEPMDLEPEAALEPEEGGEDSLDMGPADLDDAGEEEEEEEDDTTELSEEDIVSEVARRVAARLQEESSKEKLVDELAERILNRLTK
jgi:hypothetical protein